MKVLIVDDQYDKTKLFVRTLNEIGTFDITTVSNSKDALRHLNSEIFSILILDLKIPDCLGDDINPRGGIELLEFVEQNDRYITPAHIIGATSHKDAFDEFKDYFSRRGWKLFYSPDSSDELRTILTSMALHSQAIYETYDIAIITALDHVEQEAVLELPCSWKKLELINDSSIYYHGTFVTSAGEEKRILAACCPRMGIASSASLSTKLIIRHQPKYLIMTGIAAGIKKRTNIGDILIADPSWDWGSGKLTVRDGRPFFMSAPHQISLRLGLRQKLKNIAVRRLYLDEIYNSCPLLPENRPGHSINIHVGPVASGAVVLEDPVTVELIMQHNRETNGIEMEAYGLMAAAEYLATSKSTEGLVIKSVCDFADPEKNDNWQKYAAYTSAAFAFKIITNDLF